MERRVVFKEADLNYLANLCHNCGECFHACQYAPPHEFAVNVPKVLAEIRAQSYRKYSWPFLTGGAWWLAPAFAVPSLAFTPYAGIPKGVMVSVFGAAAFLVLLSWGIGLRRFLKEQTTNPPLRPRAFFDALKDVLTVSNLSSHGAGCTYPSERHSQARRWFHHLTFYGFALCFASTSTAAMYDNFLGRHPPYPYLSVPVVLGTLGGVGLIAGPLGLLALKMRRDRRLVDPRQDRMDFSFIALLLLSAITGLALMIFRATPAMSRLLAIHLAVISALFVTFACGKFVHGIYRSAALLRSALEQRSGNEREHGREG